MAHEGSGHNTYGSRAPTFSEEGTTAQEEPDRLTHSYDN
jgi:hypothetical protein